MIRLAIAAAMITAAPVKAEVATISECEISDRSTVLPVIHCNIQNRAQRAVASVVFRAAVKSPDRDVPWDEIGDAWFKRHTSIPGGIEPGETANVLMAPTKLSPRAEGLPLEVIFLEIQFIDVNGERIGEVIGTEETHPMSALNDTLDEALKPN